MEPLDLHNETVCIPVKVVKGKVRFRYPGKLPPLREGTVGDLIVPTFAVLDDLERQLLQGEATIPLMPPGAIIALAMKPPSVAEDVLDDDPDAVANLREHLWSPEKVEWGAQGSFVSITLTSHLVLKLRGTKPAVLAGGACSIQSLGVDALSLNHAYTLISTAYETDRRSHTGNVFLKGYFLDGDTWYPLQRLREREEARAEVRFMGTRKKTRSIKQASLEFGSTSTGA